MKFYDRYGGFLSNYMRSSLPTVARHSGGWTYTVRLTIYDTLLQCVTLVSLSYTVCSNNSCEGPIVSIYLIYIDLKWTLECMPLTNGNMNFIKKRVSFKRYTSQFLKLSFSLSMHLLPWRNVTPDFIWTLPVKLRGTLNKWTLQKSLHMVGFEPPTPHGLRITSSQL